MPVGGPHGDTEVRAGAVVEDGAVVCDAGVPCGVVDPHGGLVTHDVLADGVRQPRASPTRGQRADGALEVLRLRVDEGEASDRRFDEACRHACEPVELFLRTAVKKAGLPQGSEPVSVEDVLRNRGVARTVSRPAALGIQLADRSITHRPHLTIRATFGCLEHRPTSIQVGQQRVVPVRGTHPEMCGELRAARRVRIAANPDVLAAMTAQAVGWRS